MVAIKTRRRRLATALHSPLRRIRDCATDVRPYHHAHMSPVPDLAPPPPDESDRDRLFRMSLDLLCVAGLDGYFRQVNPSWTRVLGWSREELLARPVVDFVHLEDRERTLESRRRLAQTGMLSGFENRYLCKDGSYRWLSWQTSVEPGQPTVFWVARDVTERRRQDEERFVADKLESASVLAAGLAHDFNNLLAGMLLNLEMVSLSGPVEERQRRHLQQALESVHAARGLTEQLVTFARGRSSTRVLADLRATMREAVARALDRSSVRVECAFSEDLRPVTIDAAQVAQAFGNLLANAREAMPDGGVVAVRARNRTFAAPPAPSYPEGDYVEVTIADRGPGIPAGVRAKVFDPYFSTKRRADRKGMGLGLTIARAVLRRHGGLVELECPPDGGTIARCLLPAAREEGEIGGSGV
jgi:PAS domain S-box-containing protein